MRKLFHLAFALAGKDLRLYFRDKGGMALGFLLPIALVTIFGLIFGSFGDDDGGAMPKQRLRVADLDRSPASREFLASLAGGAITVIDKHGEQPFTREQLVEGVTNSGCRSDGTCPVCC